MRNKYDLGHVGSQHLRGGGVHLNQRQQQRQCYSSGTGTGTGTGTGHRHQHRQQLNVAFPYALIALFALCARCSLCARPDRALARRSTRLRRATPPLPPPLLFTPFNSPLSLSITFFNTPSQCALSTLRVLCPRFTLCCALAR